MTDQDTATPEPKDRPPRQRRRRRIGLWSMISVAVLMLAAAGVMLSLMGTPVTVPDWLRVKVVERLNRDAGPVRIDLGRAVVMVEEGWTPRLRLHDVRFSHRDSGAPIAAVSRVSGVLAMEPLLRGELRPKRVRLGGAHLSLRRDEDGAIDLALGGARAVAIAEVVASIDMALQTPALSQLTDVSADNVTLRYEDARAGRAWNVDGGRIGLSREGDALRLRGDFSLLGARDYATNLELGFSSRIGESAAQLSILVEDMPADEIAGQSPALAWLGALEAPISGALRVAVDKVGGLGPLDASLHIGQGVLKPNDAVKPVGFSSARAYFTYTPQSQTIRFTELSLDSKWGRLRAEGQALLVGAESGWPTELQSQIRLRDIVVNPAGYYPEPIALDGVNATMRLKLDPFELSLGELVLRDLGQRLVMRGTLSAVEAGWDVVLDGEMDGLSHERLLQLWPEAVKENTRRWVAENVSAGELSDIQLAVRLHPDAPPGVHLNFAYSGLQTQFVKGMPPIEEASGMASLYGDRFAIAADAGFVTAAQGGKIDIAGTSFIVPDVTIERGPALAKLKLDSSITAALSLLDSEPLHLLQKAEQSVDLAEGRAQLEGQLDFLLKKKLAPEDIVYAMRGHLHDVHSDTLVEGRELRAETLDLAADPDGIAVSGQARLGQVAVNGTWRSAFGEEAGGRSQVSGKITLSQDFVEEFGIDLPAGSVSGQSQADLSLSLNKNKGGSFSIASNLQGLGLRLDQLSWVKPAGTGGSLRIEGQLGTPPRIDVIALEAAGLSARGKISLRPDGQLQRADFAQVRLGNWLNAPVSLVGRGAGATPEVQVTGGTVDLRQTSLSSGPGSASRKGAPVTLRLDRLTISEGIALAPFNANLNTSGGTSGQFSGRVNGGAQVSGTIIPEKGRSAFRIVSNNAGGVLGSAGLLKQARGGSMELILRPAPQAGTYNGRLDASNVWLTDAPAMAALLSSLSVVGLVEQMSGNGIHFGEVAADFSLSPDLLTLYKSRAVGASMGITMDGYYHMNNSQMDMQGVISPLYLVNGIGGILTRKGEGLIGFNYKLKGSAAQPNVRILPLTIFTPGMFRNIFRRAPPGVERAADREERKAKNPDLSSNRDR
ncbi:AsmA-like C-terminal region-containing protein [Roseovarius nubinhibens]|uniref:Uncharacterized protein n=3 Tax=Roseovarius TaxID=74030 RepID=A3SR53_ROSNI|nr:AsmA-like C-terminal region-containing protein [Roseovarius nubinhibens]EAP75076.1 hypothetical protein ISM_10830 [Roseovarius nubinhibens ISM]